MGGTFDILHRGHRLLLDAAFADAKRDVFIGMTDDAYAMHGRSRKVRPYGAREAALRTFLGSRGYAARAEIGPISDVYGRALEPTFTHIAITHETQRGADRINAERERIGLKPLAPILAPFAIADDGLPVKATRVAAGEIDPEGRLPSPVSVVVGSENPVKIQAAERAFALAFGGARVVGAAVASEVPDQPREAETWEGAKARARAARDLDLDASFAVGLEAGLFTVPGIGVFDVHVACVIDRAGRATMGHGPGFILPPRALAALEESGTTVGDAIGALAGDPDIGRRTGAIGFLTADRVTRSDLGEAAIQAALVPRSRPDLYDLSIEG